MILDEIFEASYKLFKAINAESVSSLGATKLPSIPFISFAVRRRCQVEVQFECGGGSKSKVVFWAEIGTYFINSCILGAYYIKLYKKCG